MSGPGDGRSCRESSRVGGRAVSPSRRDSDRSGTQEENPGILYQ